MLTVEFLDFQEVNSRREVKPNEQRFKGEIRRFSNLKKEESAKPCGP